MDSEMICSPSIAYVTWGRKQIDPNATDTPSIHPIVLHPETVQITKKRKKNRTLTVLITQHLNRYIKNHIAG